MSHCGDDDNHGPHDRCHGTPYADPWSAPPFVRDPIPTPICLCGHQAGEHRTDLKVKQPCERGGCGCQHLRHVLDRYLERRVIDVPVPLVPVDGVV